MTRRIIWSTIICAIAAVLQSTLLAKISLFHTVPDLCLCVLVYIAYLNGSMTGQILGFSSGFILDFISAAPLGFNALLRTLIGAITGLFKGMFFMDHFILPVILCAAATLLKALIAWFLSLLFSGAVPCYNLATPTLWIEIGYNAIGAIVLFPFLDMFKTILRPRQDS